MPRVTQVKPGWALQPQLDLCITVGGGPARKDPRPPHVVARGCTGHGPWHLLLWEPGLLHLLHVKRLRLRRITGFANCHSAK